MLHRTTLPATALLLLFLATLTNANAWEQYINATVDVGGDFEANTFTLSGRYGTVLIAPQGQKVKMFGEIRAAFGITEVTTQIDEVDVDVKIENLIGAYVSLRMNQWSAETTPYVTLGFTRMTFKGSAMSETSVSRLDPSFGGGVDWKLNDKWKFNMDGMRYIETSKGAVMGFSMGISRWFK